MFMSGSKTLADLQAQLSRRQARKSALQTKLTELQAKLAAATGDGQKKRINANIAGVQKDSARMDTLIAETQAAIAKLNTGGGTTTPPADTTTPPGTTAPPVYTIPAPYSDEYNPAYASYSPLITGNEYGVPTPGSVIPASEELPGTTTPPAETVKKGGIGLIILVSVGYLLYRNRKGK